jgi:GNAT superfamily N-acetyltransferase
MEIRLAGTDEYATAADAMVAAYEQYAADLTGEEWAAYAHEIRDVDARSAYSDLLIAVEDDRIAGAVTYYRSGAGGGYGPAWPDGWPSIRLLAVRPEFRGSGLGRALTQACIDRARDEGAPGIALGTTKLMEVARAMYERMGFVHHPEFDFEPVPGINVFVYLLPLS